jgi:diguanylate cyclase (GGDEF)-like protein/PAS domain S-box-containing protein
MGMNIPTILVTAHGSEQIAVDAFHLGVQDYLLKPVETEKLDKAISQALTETRLRLKAARLTDQLNGQISWLKELSRIGQSVTSTLNLSLVLRRIVEASVQLTQAEEGFLALLDENSGQLFLRAFKTLDESKIRTMRLLVNDSLIGEVVKSGKPLRISNSSEEPKVKMSTGFLVYSLIHVPIISKEKTLGVLSVNNRVRQHPFTPENETMLSSLADYAAVAIENANLYQQAQHEISERKRVEQALRESEERYVLAIQGANDGIWDWNLKSNQIHFSPRWKSMLGYEETEIGNDVLEWFDRIHPEDVEKVKLDLSAHLSGNASHFQNEHRMQDKEGKYRWMLCRGLAIRDMDRVVRRIAGSLTDISERKTTEAKLLHDAFFDRLTGLPNRALFLDRLKNAIERVKRKPEYLFAVFFLDLDHFKNINDSLGHPVGDQLLIEVGRILKTNLRATDTVGRLGGDEFVILLEDIKDPISVSGIAEWILRRFTAPILLPEHEVFMTASMGVVVSTVGYKQPEEILRDADIALYAAKERGKSTYAIFNINMREKIIKRVELEADLRQAIDKNQFAIFYQPIYSLEDCNLVGFEALVRWQHPKRGFIQPLVFIPFAQDSGLIIAIDEWMLTQATQQIRQWRDKLPDARKLKISVNLTEKLILHPDLTKNIQKILKNSSLEGECLRLEITENAIMENTEAATQSIRSLQTLGVEVQLDDFGTGYSSLTHLLKLPVNALKIDRSFVHQIGLRNGNAEIIQTVIGLAHDLNMKAFAEGIETENQLDVLRAMQCDFGQGFLFSIPLRAEEAEKLIISNQFKSKNPQVR